VAGVRVTFKVVGLRECEEALAELSKATSKNVLKRALMNAAAPIERSAHARVKKLTGRLDRSITVGTRLSKRQRTLAKKESDVEVYVGAGPLPHAHMVEFGTSRDAPAPFLRPAVDASGKRVMEIFRDELKAEIDKASARLARKAARALAKQGV
jgi:HK97 gp10 family phage protein